MSKLSAYNHQNRYLGLPEIKLHNMHRSLDILSANKQRLEDHLFYKNKDLFNLSCDVVFYDVTTFYFESVKKDSLKDFGFSKDNKLNEVQVVMGLLVDKDGMPVGYELFPGNTYEGKTLESSLLKLKERFNIDRIIIEDFIHDKNYDYKKLDLKDKNLIVTYSSIRARNDEKKRTKLVDKAKKYLAQPSSVKASNKRGGKKFIEETTDSSYILDEEAILKDKMFDGYYAIETNDLEFSPKEIISNYGMLWKIEESFRIMKTTMEVRPVFHWTEERIKGHFVVCFLSFLLERTLELKLKEKNIEFSPERIKEALNSMNLAEVKYNNEQYLLKTSALELSNKILKALSIKPFKNITPLKEIN